MLNLEILPENKNSGHISLFQTVDALTKRS